MHVEHIEAFYDWQHFLEPLRMKLSGLAIIEGEPEVNFGFRMVTRKDLKLFHGFDKWIQGVDGQVQDIGVI